MNRRAFLLSLGAAAATAAYALPKAHASEFCAWRRGIQFTQGIDPRAALSHYFTANGVYTLIGTPYAPKAWRPAA